VPFFDFKCADCGYIHEGFVLRYDLPTPCCPNCGGSTKRIYTVAFTSGDKPMIIPGCDCHNVNSDRYNHPDHPNGARMWYKFARQCEDAEKAGRLEKIPGGDGVEKSIEAFKRAGQEL
jgi:putative FmdB family regulatory protein